MKDAKVGGEQMIKKDEIWEDREGTEWLVTDSDCKSALGVVECLCMRGGEVDNWHAEGRYLSVEQGPSLRDLVKKVGVIDRGQFAERIRSLPRVFITSEYETGITDHLNGNGDYVLWEDIEQLLKELK